MTFHPISRYTGNKYPSAMKEALNALMALSTTPKSTLRFSMMDTFSIFAMAARAADRIDRRFLMISLMALMNSGFAAFLTFHALI